jgi:hypothetical protein
LSASAGLGAALGAAHRLGQCARRGHGAGGGGRRSGGGGAGTLHLNFGGFGSTVLSGMFSAGHLYIYETKKYIFYVNKNYLNSF